MYSASPSLVTFITLLETYFKSTTLILILINLIKIFD